MGDVEVVIAGVGVLAEQLRAAAIRAECRTTIVVAECDQPATPFVDIDDAAFDSAWEQPMRRAIGAFQTAHRASHERIIVIVPTIGMSGARGLAHAAATAEAMRALVKSAARQWGADGITVNTIAVAPALFGIDAAAVGPVSLAPPALASPITATDDIAPIVAMLASRAAHSVTGATLTADGGVWMSP